MNDDNHMKSLIRNIVSDNINNIELISNTNNTVYKIITDSRILYAKFYNNNSTHIDNELKVYDLVDNKYLKEIYYKSKNSKLAIFKELVGKTVDELELKELEFNSDKIIDSVCDYFNSISSNKINGYGLLDENLNGKYDNFLTFLKERQYNTSLVLKDYKELSCISNMILNKYKDIIYSDNCLVPIDNNLKNIMILNDGCVKFVDPGEMISGPILMGYGDFVAHTYKTVLYDKLISKLNLDSNGNKLIRIYAIFSSLNILAFLKNLGVKKIEEVIPYGNTYTFYELINEHLRYLNIKI